MKRLKYVVAVWLFLGSDMAWCMRTDPFLAGATSSKEKAQNYRTSSKPASTVAQPLQPSDILLRSDPAAAHELSREVLGEYKKEKSLIKKEGIEEKAKRFAACEEKCSYFLLQDEICGRLSWIVRAKQLNKFSNILAGAITAAAEVKGDEPVTIASIGSYFFFTDLVILARSLALCPHLRAYVFFIDNYDDGVMSRAQEDVLAEKNQLHGWVKSHFPQSNVRFFVKNGIEYLREKGPAWEVPDVMYAREGGKQKGWISERYDALVKQAQKRGQKALFRGMIDVEDDKVYTLYNADPATPRQREPQKSPLSLKGPVEKAVAVESKEKNNE